MRLNIIRFSKEYETNEENGGFKRLKDGVKKVRFSFYDDDNIFVCLADFEIKQGELVEYLALDALDVMEYMFGATDVRYKGESI